MTTNNTFEIGDSVLVTWESNPKCPGTLKSNHINEKRTRKIVLPNTDGLRLKPKQGETWICHIEKITNPKSQERGAYVVKPMMLKVENKLIDAYVTPEDFSAISISLQTPGVNVLMLGPNGVGKSTNARAIIRSLGWIFGKVDCSLMKKFQHMFGKTITVPLPGGGFDLKWIESRLVKLLREASKHPEREYGYLLEELTRAEPDCRDGLLEILEGQQREFVLPTGEVIPIGNNIHFIAAGNLGEGFTVQRQDAAFLDRFAIVKIYAMPQPEELELCLRRFPGCPKKEMDMALTIINQLRRLYYDSNHPLTFYASTRGSQRVAMFLSKGMPMDLALKYAVISQYSGDAANRLTEAGRVNKIVGDELTRLGVQRTTT